MIINDILFPSKISMCDCLQTLWFFYGIIWCSLIRYEVRVIFWHVDSNNCVFTSQLKALGIDNILGFDWPASPSSEAMVRALEVLYSLGVLDDDAKLTSPTGFQVAEFPLVCYSGHCIIIVLYFWPVSIL